MKLQKSKLKAIFLCVLISMSSAYVPFYGASALSATEGQALAEEFINAAALYKCFNEIKDSNLRSTIRVNDTLIKDILLNAGTPVIHDNWLGDINCKEALAKVVGEDTYVSLKEIDEGLLGYAYTYSASQMEYLTTCRYEIFGSDGETKLPGKYYFYQGYLDKNWQFGGRGGVRSPDSYIMWDNSSKDNILWFVADTDVWYYSVRDVWAYSSYYTREYGYPEPSTYDPRLNWNLMEGWTAETAGYLGNDGDLASDDITGFCWQHFFYEPLFLNTGFQMTLEDGITRPLAFGGGIPYSIDENSMTIAEMEYAGDISIEKVDKAGQSLAEGIKDLYLDGKTPEEYLASNEELAYILQGRYLFNGDGKFKNGCNGISVDTADEKFDELKSRDDVYWNTSSAYVKELEVYSPQDSSDRKTYRTKFVDKELTRQGIDKEVTLYPGATAQKCSEVASAFNAHSNLLTGTLGASYKGAVLGYLSPVAIESFLSEEEPPAEEPPAEDPPAEDPPAENPPTEEPATVGETPTGDVVIADSEKKCYMNADEFGWVLCPMIDGLRETILGAYEVYVIPALQVNVGLFHAGDGENDGTYKAWGIFRTIANVIFLIFFVFAIFSQLTGLGIDSYGLKKMIPKMLVVAIMVNLSFIICQIAIDVGNILGRNIGELFNNITKTISVPPEIVVDSEKVLTTDAMSSFTSSVLNPILCVIVAVLGAAVVLSQGLAVIIPVLLAFISILVAVITLVAILGVRQAAVVLLVVASPIAFVCYMLPNTKPIFDKWFNAFKGLLVAFPVCSAIVYGGNMVSTILIQGANGNTWLVIAAAAIGIAPIFAIPKVIKGCMGAISMGMAKFGDKMSGRAKGAAHKRLDNSFLTRRRDYNQQRRAQKAAAKASAYGAKRGRRTMRHYGNDPLGLSARQQRNYFAAQGAVNANNDEQESAYMGEFASQTDDDIVKGLTTAASNGKLNGNMMIAGLNSIKDESQKAAILRSLSKSGNYQKLMDKDPSLRGRVASSLSGDNSIVNRGIANAMRNGRNSSDVDAMFSDGRLAQEVQKFGADAMSTQNEKLFKTEGVEDLLSEEQFKAAVTSDYSGETATALHDVMTGTKKDASGRTVDKVSKAKKSNIIKSLSAGDATHLRKMQHNGREVGSLDALGGARAIIENNPGLITTLNSKAGDNLRGSMQNDVRSELGVK